MNKHDSTGDAENRYVYNSQPEKQDADTDRRGGEQLNLAG